MEILQKLRKLLCFAHSLLHFQYAIYDLTNNVQVNSRAVYFETDFSGSYSQFLLLENVIASNQYQVDLKLKYGESILKELKVVLQ
jgi:hypothetical protein